MDFDIKITRREIIREDRNSCVSNHFWKVNGKIISADKKWSRKFRMVIWIDFCNDLWDEEFQRDMPERLVLDDMIFGYLDTIPADADFMCDDDFKEFYRICNDSIVKYNEMNKPYWERRKSAYAW